MKTQVFTKNNLDQAVKLLQEGQLLAFPTETVFGLGALASNEAAVQAVFKAKGRPSDNPLIVHLSTIDQVGMYAQHINPIEVSLMKTFWPGPLTIIFPLKPGSIAPSVSPSGQTVALRIPQEPLTLEVIGKVGQGLVGPSANKSGKPSPTVLSHVLHDFDGEIAGVIDPGHDLLAVGIESTVVKIVNDTIHILRPGAITRSQLEELGYVVKEETVESQLKNDHLLSPGVKYRHYSPDQPVYLVQSEDVSHFLHVFAQFKGQNIGLLADDSLVQALQDTSGVEAVYAYGPRGNAQAASQTLYAGLRFLEATACDVIIAQSFDQEGPFHAMMNRLNKAGKPWIEDE